MRNVNVLLHAFGVCVATSGVCAQYLRKYQHQRREASLRATATCRTANSTTFECKFAPCQRQSGDLKRDARQLRRWLWGPDTLQFSCLPVPKRPSVRLPQVGPL